MLTFASPATRITTSPVTVASGVLAFAPRLPPIRSRTVPPVMVMLVLGTDTACSVPLLPPYTVASAEMPTYLVTPSATQEI